MYNKLKKYSTKKCALLVLSIYEKLQTFIGLINYDRYMWKHRSGILIPLSSMTSKQAK